MLTNQRIATEPLTPTAFAPFGQVLAAGLGTVASIRNDTVELTRLPFCLQHDANAPKATLDVYEVSGEPLPVICGKIERHPLSAQMFQPVGRGKWLIAVWPDGPAGSVRAFVASDGQGVVYRQGLWHQGVVAIDQPMTFLSLLYRGTGTEDTEWRELPEAVGIGDAQQ